MESFSATPKAMWNSFASHRQLVAVCVKREVLGRYRGSLIGLFWSFFNPVLMLVVYTFVFSEIFNARWSVESESKTEFALVLFSGLIVFNLFSECVTRAPGLILSNVNYVKKVIFPLEILPLITLFSALFHAMVSLLVWVVAYGILFGVPPWTILFLPLILIPFSLFITGLCWFLSSLGVYVRDVSHFIGILTTVLMFLSPLFYPVTALPEFYRWFLYINPLTPVMEQTRAVLYWGQTPNFEMLVIYWFSAMLTAWLGFVWFQKTRKGFADVL